MNELHFADDGQTFQMTFPITKVDDEKRMVEGVATAEREDSQKDILDHAASRQAFSEWQGNVREMHGNLACGRRVSQHFDDINKQTIVRAYISRGAESTWQKIKDKVLTSFSVGGRCLESAKEIVKTASGDHTRRRVTKYSLSELSLVDAPALSGTQFALVKSVNGALVPTDILDELPQGFTKLRAPDYWELEDLSKSERFEKFPELVEFNTPAPPGSLLREELVGDGVMIYKAVTMDEIGEGDTIHFDPDELPNDHPLRKLAEADDLAKAAGGEPASIALADLQGETIPPSPEIAEQFSGYPQEIQEYLRALLIYAGDRRGSRPTPPAGANQQVITQVEDAVREYIREQEAARYA